MVFSWKPTSRRFFGTGSKYGFSPTGAKPGRWARRSRPGLCGQRSSARGGRGGGGGRGGNWGGRDGGRGAGGGGLRIRRVARPVSRGVARGGNRLDAGDRVSHGRVRGDERGPSGVVPALLAGALVRPRAGEGVSPVGWRDNGRGSRVPPLRRAAAPGGTVPGDHGNRRERASGVHRPAGVRFRRSARGADGGTRPSLPHAAGTRRSVRAAGGCAAARALADRAVFPAGAAGVGVR